MKPQDFEYYRQLLLRRSGLSLGDEKIYLLESRLLPVVQRFGLASLDDLTAAIRFGHETLAHAVVDAMTTNETSFFRDSKPFEAFRRVVLPSLLARRGERRFLRVLSAAAATGQEAYSLAMLLREEAERLRDWPCEVVGLDISDSALDRARAGVFTPFEVQRGLTPPLLTRHFEKHGGEWKINKEIRNMVSFHKYNLLDDLARFGDFDVVFCRNVLIYFEMQTKARVLANIARRLRSDGYLFLGSAETLIGLSVPFAPMDAQSGIYQPAAALVGDGAAARPCAAVG